MKISSFFVLLSALICFGIYEANASKAREHKAHAHGIAKLDISIDSQNNKIEVDLDIPGKDLVGFEGAAKSQKQKDNLKTVTDTFNTNYSILLLPEAADCNVTKRKLDVDHKNKAKDHSDYEYEVEYTCKDVSQITEFDVNLFRDIESLSEVSLQLVTDKNQKALKLKPTASKVSVK